MTEPITSIRVLPRHEDRARLAVNCSRGTGGECLFSLWQRPASGAMWQWDGNTEKPTITPSIDCRDCGRHFTVVAGNAQ